MIDRLVHHAEVVAHRRVETLRLHDGRVWVTLTFRSGGAKEIETLPMVDTAPRALTKLDTSEVSEAAE